MQQGLPFGGSDEPPAQHLSPRAPQHLGTAAPTPPVFVRHRRARRYIIRVRPDGLVRVTLPAWGSKREAMAFFEREQEWIGRERRRWEAERIRAAANAPAPEVERQLRQRAREELPSRTLALAHEFGLTVSRVSVRNQRRRWGSCSRRGHVCLNWRLVEAPDWVRDYVIVHELMHLRRMDHSPQFWKLVARACPEYREARAWLRQWERDIGTLP